MYDKVGGGWKSCGGDDIFQPSKRWKARFFIVRWMGLNQWNTHSSAGWVRRRKLSWVLQNHQRLKHPHFIWKKFQDEWCEKLLSGKKKIEVRQYKLPDDLYHEPILLIATHSQTDGTAALKDVTAAGSDVGRAVGWVIFSNPCIEYTTEERFRADEPLHCIPADSVYAFKQRGILCLVLLYHRQYPLYITQLLTDTHWNTKKRRCRPMVWVGSGGD